MKVLSLVILSMIILFDYNSPEAATIRFMSSGEQFSDKPIYESNIYDGIIGLVGDRISLRDGRYFVSIDLPNHHKARIILMINVGKVDIIEANVYPPPSGGVYYAPWETSWQSPKMVKDKPYALTTIRLEDVQFIREIVEETYISVLPSSLACDRQSLSISVTSEPSNAEIWVHGEDTGFRTPSRGLRASFCESDSHVNLMLRKRGWINYLKRLRAIPGEKFQFHSVMQR